MTAGDEEQLRELFGTLFTGLCATVNTGVNIFNKSCSQAGENATPPAGDG